MPMYTVSAHSPLPENIRQPLAQLIMKVHCELTGAPETFVQVVMSFGVPLEKKFSLQVFGNVRKGRTADAKQLLAQTLNREIAALLQITSTAVDVSLLEVPASWVMEGGEVLPEPGEEDQCEWLNDHLTA
jgi:phenylpyruvate tautomerase PptA (4-oxalocrotonate tautomerase family)